MDVSGYVSVWSNLDRVKPNRYRSTFQALPGTIHSRLESCHCRAVGMDRTGADIIRVQNDVFILTTRAGRLLAALGAPDCRATRTAHSPVHCRVAAQGCSIEARRGRVVPIACTRSACAPGSSRTPKAPTPAPSPSRSRRLSCARDTAFRSAEALALSTGFDHPRWLAYHRTAPSGMCASENVLILAKSGLIQADALLPGNQTCSSVRQQ